MYGVQKLWTWLGKERNRTVLTFLGAGFTAVVAALWQAYVHFAPTPTRVQPAQSQPQVQTATAVQPASADVAAAENLRNSQASALNAEADALDREVTQKIQAAEGPPARH